MRLDIRWQFSAQPQRFFLPLLVGLHGSTDTTARKSAIIEEKMFWKVTLPSTLIFSAKMFARLTLQFLFTYICICNRVRSVSFSNGGLRDRDIIFRDETDLVFCFLGCVGRFPAREANSWRRRASSNPGSRVCVFFSRFSFPSYRFSVLFLRSNAHTHINKEGANTLGKAERRQRAACFTQFMKYRFV